MRRATFHRKHCLNNRRMPSPLARYPLAGNSYQSNSQFCKGRQKYVNEQRDNMIHAFCVFKEYPGNEGLFIRTNVYLFGSSLHNGFISVYAIICV